MRALGLGLLATLVLTLAPATGAAQSTYDIRWNSSDQISRIGKLRYVDSRPIGLAQLRKVFGRPSKTKAYRQHCIVRWRKLGLEVTLTTWGLSNRTCGRKSGKVLQAFSVSGPGGGIWLVQDALRVGMTEDQMKAAFPDGYEDDVYDQSAFVLRDTYVGYGEDGWTPLAWAELNYSNNVRKISFWVGGAGD